MVYMSEIPLEYPRDATISDLLLKHNPRNTAAEKSAIINGISGQTVYTFGSLRSMVKKFANELQLKHGVRRGIVVSILCTNTVHYPIYVHGSLAAGAVVSALNPMYRPEELAHALKIAKPKIILASEDLLPTLKTALAIQKPPFTPPAIILIDPIHQTPFKSLNLAKIAAHGSKFVDAVKLSESQIARELAFICFSSGTSGLPKGVKISHGNIVSNVFQHSIHLSDMFIPSSVFVLVVPFFHILGLGAFTCQYLSMGSPVVVFPRFDFPALLKSISRDRVTHINVVPPIALEFLRNPLSRTADFSSVKVMMNAAAPLEQALADRLQSLVECTITQWYGLTEASPSVISQRTSDTHVRGSIGKLLPGISLQIVAENGSELPHGSPGELCISGPNIMQGYIGADVAQETAFTRNGFLRTGDIGYVDKDGYVFLVDRVKEMIKVKGNQVAPAEIEGILRTHPAVMDAAVCGTYARELASDVPIAYIVTNIGATANAALAAELADFVGQRVASYKRLRGGVVFIDQIPRNPAGKILRRQLAAGLAKAFSTKTSARQANL